MPRFEVLGINSGALYDILGWFDTASEAFRFIVVGRLTGSIKECDEYKIWDSVTNLYVLIGAQHE